MPKASEVAAELRKLADGLDEQPDAPITKPYIYFTHLGDGEKSAFIALARSFPRPFEKVYKNDDLRLEYVNRAMDLTARINRDAVCRIVEPAKPAKYECEPLLSAEEENDLGGAA